MLGTVSVCKSNGQMSFKFPSFLRDIFFKRIDDMQTKYDVVVKNGKKYHEVCLYVPYD